MNINTYGKTYTFYDSSRQFLITVKTEFLHRCFDPATHDVYDLNTQYLLSKFLHNPAGPAVVDTFTGLNQYWIDGKRLSDKDSEQFSARIRYEGKLMDLIS